MADALIAQYRESIRLVQARRDQIRAERDAARADAERLANALDMAADFLGMAIPNSPRNAAWVAQQALAAHVEQVAAASDDAEPADPAALHGKQRAVASGDETDRGTTAREETHGT